MRTQSPGTQQWHRPPTLHPTPAGPQAQPEATPGPSFPAWTPSRQWRQSGAGSAKPPSSPLLLGSDLVRRGSAGSAPRTPLGIHRPGRAVLGLQVRYSGLGSRPSPATPTPPLTVPRGSRFASPCSPARLCVQPCALPRAQARNLTAGGCNRAGGSRRAAQVSGSWSRRRPPRRSWPGPCPPRRGGVTRRGQGPPTPARWHPPELSYVPGLSSYTSSSPPLVGSPNHVPPFPQMCDFSSGQ